MIVGLIGEPFEIESKSQFDTATITFKIDQIKLGDIALDNLLFLWYGKENYEFVEMETIHDAINSTVSITTTHFSKYMLISFSGMKLGRKNLIIIQERQNLMHLL